MSIIEQISTSLNKIRPSLQADGGDVELVSFDETDGTAKVRLTGMCAGCPMAAYTLKEGIEAEVKKDIPQVKRVEAV